MNFCQRCRAQLGEFLDGTLSAPDREKVAAHLDTCSDCARELHALKATRAALRDWSPVAAPAEIRLKVRAALQNEARARQRPDFASTLASSFNFWRPQKFAWAGTMTLSAIILLVLARPFAQQSPMLPERSVPASESSSSGSAEAPSKVGKPSNPAAVKRQSASKLTTKAQNQVSAQKSGGRSPQTSGLPAASQRFATKPEAPNAPLESPRKVESSPKISQPLPEREGSGAAPTKIPSSQEAPQPSMMRQRQMAPPAAMTQLGVSEASRPAVSPQPASPQPAPPVAAINRAEPGTGATRFNAKRDFLPSGEKKFGIAITALTAPPSAPAAAMSSSQNASQMADAMPEANAPAVMAAPRNDMARLAAPVKPVLPIEPSPIVPGLVAPAPAPVAPKTFRFRVAPDSKNSTAPEMPGNREERVTALESRAAGTNDQNGGAMAGNGAAPPIVASAPPAFGALKSKLTPAPFLGPRDYRLTVAAPRDAQNAQIRLILPSSLRFDQDDANGSRVIWRGDFVGGKPVKIEFSLLGDGGDRKITISLEQKVAGAQSKTLEMQTLTLPQ